MLQVRSTLMKIEALSSEKKAILAIEAIKIILNNLTGDDLSVKMYLFNAVWDVSKELCRYDLQNSGIFGCDDETQKIKDSSYEIVNNALKLLKVSQKEFYALHLEVAFRAGQLSMQKGRVDLTVEFMNLAATILNDIKQNYGTAAVEETIRSCNVDARSIDYRAMANILLIAERSNSTWASIVSQAQQTMKFLRC